MILNKIINIVLTLSLVSSSALAIETASDAAQELQGRLLELSYQKGAKMNELFEEYVKIHQANVKGVKASVPLYLNADDVTMLVEGGLLLGSTLFTLKALNAGMILKEKLSNIELARQEAMAKEIDMFVRSALDKMTDKEVRGLIVKMINAKNRYISDIKLEKKVFNRRSFQRMGFMRYEEINLEIATDQKKVLERILNADAETMRAELAALNSTENLSKFNIKIGEARTSAINKESAIFDPEINGIRSRLQSSFRIAKSSSLVVMALLAEMVWDFSRDTNESWLNTELKKRSLQDILNSEVGTARRLLAELSQTEGDILKVHQELRGLNLKSEP